MTPPPTNTASHVTPESYGPPVGPGPGVRSTGQPMPWCILDGLHQGQRRPGPQHLMQDEPIVDGGRPR